MKRFVHSWAAGHSGDRNRPKLSRSVPDSLDQTLSMWQLLAKLDITDGGRCGRRQRAHMSLQRVKSATLSQGELLRILTELKICHYCTLNIITASIFFKNTCILGVLFFRLPHVVVGIKERSKVMGIIVKQLTGRASYHLINHLILCKCKQLTHPYNRSCASLGISYWMLHFLFFSPN